jgi:hypothetical protein
VGLNHRNKIKAKSRKEKVKIMTHKGKMVYCKETFQVFPSVKAAAEYHKIGYHSIAKNVEGKTKIAYGKHFIYVENTADLSQFFSDTRKEEKYNEAMRKATEEEIAKLTAAQKEIARQLAETRKIMKKYM